MPKKKTRSNGTSLNSVRNEIRKNTAYKGARAWFSLPFMISGTICLGAGGFVLIGALASSKGVDSVTTLPSIGAIVSGLFLFGVAALASAIFDTADAALFKYQRDKNIDALASYQQAKASQPYYGQ